MAGNPTVHGNDEDEDIFNAIDVDGDMQVSKEELEARLGDITRTLTSKIAHLNID